MLVGPEADAGLQALVDHSTAAIFVKDRGGRYVLVNEAFLRGLGKRRDEVLGRTVEEIWSTPSEATEIDMRILASGVAETRDQVVAYADGKEHTVMTVRFPLRDAAGEIEGLAAIATDVSERKEVEEALREHEDLLETILGASPDVVTVLDARGRVTAVSRASEDILGYDLSDPVHEDLEALVHPEDLAGAYLAYRRLFTGESAAVEARYRTRHADGHWVTFDTRAQAIIGEHGAVEGVVAVSRDVSVDLQFEAELERALEVAQKSSFAKSEFLSRMSHELRTPLNSVLGFAQLLEMEQLAPDHEQAVGHILQAGHHLLDLIDEVLDISRIESGHFEMDPHPVAVDELLREAIALTQPHAEMHEVDVVLGSLPEPDELVAVVDRQRLLQVLLNLLTNATKYNRSGGRVVVSASCLEDEQRWLAIDVVDSGPGIPEDALERIFDPFERLGAERSQVEGTGVGLTLTKRIVDQMGGEISVASKPGVGTTFTVKLASARLLAEDVLTPETPDVRAPGEPQPRESVAGKEGERGVKRVLYVEDNLDNLELVEQVLRRVGGFELLSATDGAEALAIAEEQDLDLVLLDLHLPDLQGHEVLERLRATARAASVPVIVVSADATALSRHRVSDAVVAYLTKPIDVHELLRVIEGVVVAAKPS